MHITYELLGACRDVDVIYKNVIAAEADVPGWRINDGETGDSDAVHLLIVI